MKKFNLSVPDALARKIDARRDQLGNLSAIFRDALADRIRKQEEFEERLKGDQDMETIIARLKKEKTQLRTDYFSKGKEDGLRWAKAASYKDLEYAGRFEPEGRDGLYDPTTTLHDDVLGHYFIDALEADPLTDPGYDEDDLNEHAKKWLDGWLEAVHQFRQEISDKI
ncbi:MAG: hypothetical protein RDU20_05645 [Desulfomonilaceae bacterium]|nr:hypothetical protein [Desulfomonilaceae bacterium]